MSSYTYRCKSHGEFTVERSMNDSPVEVCEVVGCDCNVVRVFVSPMIDLSFKGSYNSTRKEN